MTNIAIKKISDSNIKSSIVQEVLNDLPEWFGLPDSTKEYIEESRTLELWVALMDEEVIGFITLTASSADCAEIHCMGVKKRYHRKGVGKSLFQILENEAKEKYDYIQVKTVDEGHYKEYDQTIAFYKNQGFAKLEVFPTLWDEWNPCLVLIKKV
ncbi:GNAT family N-acetyltransferase [Alkalibacterium iburiense]|uniref:GNAT family N-acetyltransferase n=1 Tax=Alkalibacterium iburiense TaxID=290589 RepID=A0ABN0X024_9LACT